MFKFSIVAKPDLISKKCEEEVKSTLIANSWIYDENDPYYVIVIGGDGTILRAIHRYLDKIESIRLLGIHTGTLGFFTEYNCEDVNEALETLINKRYILEYRRMLEADVLTKDGKHMFYAINEMRLENIMRTQVIEVAIDGEHLETIRANGVCVSTPSGSTAYNKSLGGAVICPGIEVMQLCEVAGIHHNRYHSLGSPLIASDQQTFTFTSSDFRDISLVFDHVVANVDDVIQVDTRLSTRKVPFLRKKGFSFAQRLRNSFIND
ncbi:TPA: NAD kinase [bacterium]|nr:NAD kinase [bacterium]